MITTSHISKSYGTSIAVNDICVTIQKGEVFGLIGTNGAGKSTFLRMVSGIMKPDCGTILVDDRPVYENVEAKRDIFFIPDEHYFITNANAVDMMKFYQDYYPSFDGKRFLSYLDQFGLDKKRHISTFSKGMKKQLSVLLGVCANTKYLFCDETFDGLDPVMRQAVKSIFMGEMTGRDFTPVIASHNLRELEDICDCVGLLHQGGILLQKDLAEMKLNIHTVQCVFDESVNVDEVLSGIDVLKIEKRGMLHLITARGKDEDIMKQIYAYSPVFAESLPLTLEEIFISETEVVGYDIKKLIL